MARTEQYREILRVTPCPDQRGISYLWHLLAINPVHAWIYNQEPSCSSSEPWIPAALCLPRSCKGTNPALISEYLRRNFSLLSGVSQEEFFSLPTKEKLGHSPGWNLWFSTPWLWHEDDFCPWKDTNFPTKIIWIWGCASPSVPLQQPHLSHPSEQQHPLKLIGFWVCPGVWNSLHHQINSCPTKPSKSPGFWWDKTKPWFLPTWKYFCAPYSESALQSAEKQTEIL